MHAKIQPVTCCSAVQEHMRVVPQQLRTHVRVRELVSVEQATQDAMLAQARPLLLLYVAMMCTFLQALGAHAPLLQLSV